MDGGGGEEEEEGATAKPAAADTNTDATATAPPIAAAGSTPAKEDDAIFHTRLAEVKQFVAEHGPGVAIPDAYPPNEALGKWATQKRKQKRRADAGQTTRLTADRIAALDEAGFVWQVWGNRAEKWDEMFGRLVEFRDSHGGSTRIVHSLRAKDPRSSPAGHVVRSATGRVQGPAAGEERTDDRRAGQEARRHWVRYMRHVYCALPVCLFVCFFGPNSMLPSTSGLFASNALCIFTLSLI